MPDLATLIKRLVDSYETFEATRGTKICSFTLVTADGKHSCESLAEICHADLKYVVANKYDVLLTSYPAKVDVDFRFFKFMVDRLYRKWSEYIHLEQAEDGQYYIRITDLDKIPANVVYNFCICSRVIVEYRHALTAWDELVLEHEFDPVFAFAVCISASGLCKPMLDRKVNFVSSFDGHWPFDNTVDLFLLINGQPEKTSASYKERPKDSSPTNCIWGYVQHLRKLEGSTIREFWNEWKEKCPS